MSYDRRWLEEAGSEDSHGRTLWALGECARHDADPSRRRWAAGALQDRPSGGRGILLSTSLGLHALGVGRLLPGGRRRSLRQSHARTAGRQIDDHACGQESRRLALVRRRARIRQRTPSSGSDRDGPGNSHAALRRGRPAIAALAHGAADHAVGLLQAGRDPRASARYARNQKRSISSPWKRQQRFPPAFQHGR